MTRKSILVARDRAQYNAIILHCILPLSQIEIPQPRNTFSFDNQYSHYFKTINQKSVYNAPMQPRH
jgi:hypothetical protein